MKKEIKPYRKTKKDAVDLQKTAKELIRLAKEGGVEQNYFFTTAFERYQQQIDILNRLSETLDSEDLMIEKEYIKGKVCTVAHPAISEYNKTSTAANQTAQTLIKIIVTFANGELMNKDGSDEFDL